ncbi:glycosyltransferase [Sulfurimonas sp. HSL1-2]|uniref:glycosyltransferase n=1 Tax=Thiomicrolovo zhangzhouensis TaxID=3131933 RepID=UPI0031F9BCEB
MMTKVILIPEFFPYGIATETFLESEVKYWAERKDVELIIMPMKVGDDSRQLPSSIKVDQSFANYLNKHGNHRISSKFYKILYAIRVLFTTMFWTEIFAQKIFDIAKIKDLMLSMRKYFVYKHFFGSLQKQYPEAIYYTYWHTEVTYALQRILKGSRNKLITRTHRFDLYEDTTLHNYMPLRRQFVRGLDHIFTITDSGIDYLSTTYGFDKKNITTSRLGVDDKQINANATGAGIFHIVSCSALRPVKRVDKIIDLLGKLSEQYPGVSFVWSHIGDGPLEKQIKEYAFTKLSRKENVQYNLLGMLSNEDVYSYYESHAVDVFINASESEGVPVSMMEAMSCHIPVVAPDVGGISDMIEDGYNGKLLSEKSEVDEYFIAFTDLSFFKDTAIRENAYKVFKDKYLASENYRQFILYLIHLCDDRIR